MFINIGSLDLRANHDITQHIEVVSDMMKERRLMQLLEQLFRNGDQKTLVFVETKRKVHFLAMILSRTTSILQADELTRCMRRDGWPALSIHGDKQQGERDWVLNGKEKLSIILHSHLPVSMQNLRRTRHRF